jgi:type IV secretory pathway VirD2 relaxase
MSPRDENWFRPKVGPPRSRGSGRSPFAKEVLAQVSLAGPAFRAGRLKSPLRKGTRLGRGHVASKFAGQSLTSRARRVVIKSRLVVFKGRGRQSTEDHESYVEREGVDRNGGRGQLYGAITDHADGNAFAERCSEDRHQFRFIVSPEDAAQLDDLKAYTRELMAQMERDLGTRLDWVAVDHWDTDNPHTHVLLRGKDQNGRDLVIARDYLSHGMRLRAAEIATEWLGPRTELEIREGLTREVQQERWTSLDRTLQQQHLRNGIADLRQQPSDTQDRFRHALLIGRLDRLVEMGLASKVEPGVWTVAPQAEATLRAMGERGDIIRTMQRAFSVRDRDHMIFDPTRAGGRVTGRIAAKGLVDELHERGYLIVDGVDGRAHYVALPANADPAAFPQGSVVTVRAGADARPADRTIAAVSEGGIYRADQHLAQARTRERNPDAFVQAHVRRLESLRRGGIVERMEEGVWRVPPDLIERGRDYDAKRTQSALVDLRSELSITQQVRAIGATWLDRQLVGRPEALASKGFGAEVEQTLAEREMFLVEQGFAERRGQRVVLMRDLLATLRARDVEQAARAIEADSGLVHRPVGDGQTVSGVYTRSVALVSGRFAMLEDGVGFSLVPWRPFIDKRIGQSMSAVVRGEHASWEVGRQRGVEL